MLQFLRRILLKKVKSEKQKTIVVLSFKFLGDTVFTIPMISLLKKKYKGYEICIVCYPENKIIYKLKLQNINYYTFQSSQIQIENRKFNFKFVTILKLLYDLNPEIIYDITSNYKSALVCYFSMANKTFGFGNKLLKYFYLNFKSNPAADNAIDYFITASGLINEKRIISNSEYFESENINHYETILIIPSAGWSAKEWGVRKFLSLASNLKNDYKIRIVSQPNFFCEDVIRWMEDNSINYSYSYSIDDLINFIKNSDILISNDTGPIYISALLGKTTVTIFGPTGKEYHKIPGERHLGIYKDLSCSPKKGEKLCFTFGGRIGCPSNECMQLLSTEEVIIKIRNFLDNPAKVRDV